MSPTRILIVDDDKELTEMLEDYLGSEGLLTTSVHHGDQGLSQILTGEFDLVILDLMLPSLNGLDVIRQVRPQVSTPIIFLTARGNATDRIVGLELGADDYLSKPFDPRELLARIHAILRRGIKPSGPSDFKIDDIRLVPASRTAFLGNASLTLTSVEYDLLLALVRKAGQVISRNALAQEIGRQLLPFDRTIDMHILNLRKKLGDSRIVTVRGSGYMLALLDSTP